MSSAYRIQNLSVEQYLAGELAASVRHEYIDGELFAMVGASRSHNMLSLNVAAALKSLLAGTTCRVTVSDMKLKMPSGSRFYYPDVMVACSNVNEEPDDYFETQPSLVVEILSPSTESVDRREKRLAYATINSLNEYILVSQHEVRVELFRRESDGWSCTTLTVDDTLTLVLAGGLKLPIAALYEGVPLAL